MEEEGLGVLGLGAGVLLDILKSEWQMNRQSIYDLDKMSFQQGSAEYLMNKQHDLTSPLQQRKDLAEAGFSSSLMLSGTPASTVSQSSGTSGGYPTMPTIDGAFDVLIKQQQAKQLKIENDYAPRIRQAELKNIKVSTQKLASERELNDQQRDLIEVTMPFLIGKSFADWQEVCNKVLLLQQQITKTTKETSKIEQETANLEQQHELGEFELSFEEFRKRWREEVGIDYSDDQIALAFGLLKKGELLPALNTILDAISQQLTDPAFVKKGVQNVGTLTNLPLLLLKLFGVLQ